ncbi:MAG TPA: TonB-dependent receptor, partial [Longimicrobiales bacterium]
MSWRRIPALLLMLLSLPALTFAQAQSGTITGTVTATDTNTPIPGVNVFVVGTSRGAVTGADGRYVITGVSPGSRIVRAASIGYAQREQTINVAAGQTNTVNFSLLLEAVQLREIVAIGYGTTTRREATGAISTVTTEALEHAPVQSIDQMLQGTSPGVQVTTGSSEPGGALSVRIRGTSSITGNSEPLYVIDGFPIENDIEGSSVGNGGRTRTTPPNPLITLNPSDVESITVLKDASATAIYGARGANGVIIITTKQGRGTRPQFSLDYYTGIQSVAKRYDLLNAQEWMDYANEFGANSGTPFTPFPDSVYNRVLATGVNTDWLDAIFRNAPVQNLQLSVRGAAGSGSTTRYALSGGFFDQDGVVETSGLRRLSARLNLSQSIGQRIELGGTFSASQAKSKSVPTAGQQNGGAGSVSGALQYVPILPIQRDPAFYQSVLRDTALIRQYNGLGGTYSELNPDMNLIVGTTALDAAPVPNPVSMLEVRDSLSDTRVLGNMFGRAELLPGLEARVSVGADYANRWRHTYYPRTTTRGRDASGEALRGIATTISWLNENTLTYRREFAGRHDFTVLGGYSYQQQDVDGENMSNSNFVSDITGYFDIGAGTQEGGPEISSRHTAQTLKSWLGRLNYSLMDRYLFTATVRTDGSSRFAEGKKWGTFPSLAAAWRLSEEPWFKNGFTSVNDLKLRASWGEVGNPSIRPYQSLARLNDQGYSFGGTPVAGYYPTSVANKDLTWETTEQVDLGLDVAFLERFSLTVDWYTKKTTDLLLLVQLPMESGFESALANRGSVQNRGIEVGLEARILNPATRDGFGWHANLNFARNKNKVLDLGGPQSIFADLITTDFNLPGTMIEVGKPIGRFYGFISDGIVRDAADSARITWTNFSNGRFRPGDMIIRDIAGRDSLGNLVMTPDGRITLDDRTDIGDPTPDFTIGLTNTISYKFLELTGLLQGSYGGKILNVNRIRTESSPRVNISRERWEERWTPANPGGAFPRIGENPNQVGPNNFTSNLLEDGSYLRLRTLTLSVLVPQSVQQRLRLSASRVYVTGTNVFTISDYSGFDPDVSAQ